jgi:hypothetical protein
MSLTMAYTVRYSTVAKSELADAFQVYGTEFEHDVNSWLHGLATKAETKDNSFTVDLVEILEQVDRLASQPKSSWQLSWDRLHELGGIGKLQALLTAIRTRRLPWELRAADSPPFNVVGAFNSVVTVVYEIDHVEQRIIVRFVRGLPGQS